MRHVPQRVFISDLFEGYLATVGKQTVLSIQPQEGADSTQQGKFSVRYGVVYLGRSYLSIVPDLIALDYGDALNGEEAWDFLFNKSNLYPRADVFGFRDDGLDEMITVKSLDLMHPLRVWAYASAEDKTPISQIHAVIAPEEALLPERITQYCPRYASLDAWRKALSK